jgi:hypothetical protein
MLILDDKQPAGRSAAFGNRRALALVILLAGTIQSAAADETADAAQTLTKYWTATLDANNQFVTNEKAYARRSDFKGDGETYRMRNTFRQGDGAVKVCIGEAPFRFLEIDPKPVSLSADESSSYLLGVRCLFNRDCIKRTCTKYDPIFNPTTNPESYSPVAISSSSGVFNPANAWAVKNALETLLRLNAAPPFDPDAPQR